FLLANVIQAGIGHHADDLQVPPVPRIHDIETLAERLSSREKLFGEVLAHNGHSRRMFVVLPTKITASPQRYSRCYKKHRCTHFEICFLPSCVATGDPHSAALYEPLATPRGSRPGTRPSER